MPDNPYVLAAASTVIGMAASLVGWIAKSWWDQYTDNVSDAIDHTASDLHGRIEKQEQRHDEAQARNQEVHESMMARIESVEELVPKTAASIRADMAEEHAKLRGELVSVSVFRQHEKRFDALEARFGKLEDKIDDIPQKVAERISG